MLLTQEDCAIDEYVENPSIGVAVYQAQLLRRQLRAITREDYPAAAIRIRDVFDVVAEFVESQLRSLYDPNRPHVPTGPAADYRLQALARIVRTLAAYLRFLRASSPTDCPPAIQLALEHLTRLYFPSVTTEPGAATIPPTSSEPPSEGTPSLPPADPRSEPHLAAICLVRPQWNYNFTYVAVTTLLRENVLLPDVLDPYEYFLPGHSSVVEPSETAPEELLAALWRRRFPQDASSRATDQVPILPEHIGILSFPRLDTEDTLLLPLLAHELGHFIDFSHKPPLHRRNPSWQHVDSSEVEAACLEAGSTPPPERLIQYQEWLSRLVSTCIRELIADLLAVRIMGLGFFVAQAEFLKTVGRWDTADVSPRSGYPGFRYRLRTILEELWDEGTLGAFLDSHATPDKDGTHKTLRSRQASANALRKYLERWQARLTAPANVSTRTDDVEEILVRKVVEPKVTTALSEIRRLARAAIPGSKVAVLSPTFFDRIELIRNELPPLIEPEIPHCFSEVLSAAWAYQVLWGEGEEVKLTSRASETDGLGERGQEKSWEDAFEEYRKTCRLVLKAIELLPYESPLHAAPQTVG
ncbi:MAG: hypothetical protein IT379_14710 [Deltaproteobacteria bacterium]|nr:hypothetical protein [Deltaproteobacteria bacterium]